MGKLIKGIRKPFLITITLMVLCGFIYPLMLTVISQVLFPRQAGGSLIFVHEKAVGSELIGQDFTEKRFMKGRPSAVGYNTYTKEQLNGGEYSGIRSGSENYGPSNPELLKRVSKDMEQFLELNPSVKKEEIPGDLMTASGSGLDPHISPEAAAIQIPGLAKATGLTQERLKEIVEQNTQGKFLGIFGEKRVHVLKVNLQIAEDLE